MDAFRWDYPDVFETPGLNEIAADGVRCVMEPSYPASTFPNHYTIATGLVPDHHGIVNGSFWNPDTQETFSMGDSLTRYNPDYYLGEPIWVTAEKQGVKTACIYWVGSDVPIEGVLPTYTYPWWEQPRLSFEERANETVRLLSLPKEKRPGLVMLYFDEPDGTSHRYGPLAQETREISEYLDSIVGDMYRQLKALPYGKKINIIVTSDHGMTDISDDRFVDWDDYLDSSWYEHIVGTSPTNIYAKENLSLIVSFKTNDNYTRGFCSRVECLDIFIEAKEIEKLRTELFSIIAEHSGQPYAKVAADGERNFWMTAQEALEYGMVDQILTKK